MHVLPSDLHLLLHGNHLFQIIFPLHFSSLSLTNTPNFCTFHFRPLYYICFCSNIQYLYSYFVQKEAPHHLGLCFQDNMTLISSNILVMEQTDSCECHCHSVFVTCTDDVVITNRATRLRNIFYTALMSSFDVVTKWEEGI